MPAAEKVIDALGTGRRKTSVARVRIRAGNGKLTINERDAGGLFHDPAGSQRGGRAAGARGRAQQRGRGHPRPRRRQHGPGRRVHARHRPGADALRQRLSDAKLREKHFLTRDARMKERKKPGLHGARRGTQFSKR